MEKLFTEFKSVSAAEWKVQLEKDLKGITFSDLIWHSENEIDVKPFYTKEDLKEAYYPAFSHADWLICAKPFGKTTSEKNASLLRALTGGASSILIKETDDLASLLNGVNLEYIRSTFVVTNENAAQLLAYLQENYKDAEIQCSVFLKGSSSGVQTDEIKKLIETFKSLKLCSTLTVDTTPYHNSNCTAVFELALMLSMLTEQLEFLGTCLPESPFVIKTAVNADFFTQIAKLRAMQRLWAIFKEEYKLKNDLHLLVESSLVNKTISDKYNNLLRTTVEAMAAIAGGCNELLLHDFDVFSTESSTLAQRMSVNQHHILKDETYLDKIADVCCGSYFVESLTDELASEALKHFKLIEQKGGFNAYLKSGELDQELSTQAKKAEEAFISGQALTIGVNKFRNEKENINVDKNTLRLIKQLNIQNPALQYELNNFIK